LRRPLAWLPEVNVLGLRLSFTTAETPKNVTNVYHPQYSPELSPLDYFLFSKLKMKLQELRFADNSEMQEDLMDE
jgi:hypothetical protein